MDVWLWFDLSTKWLNLESYAHVRLGSQVFQQKVVCGIFRLFGIFDLVQVFNLTLDFLKFLHDLLHILVDCNDIAVKLVKRNLKMILLVFHTRFDQFRDRSQVELFGSAVTFLLSHHQHFGEIDLVLKVILFKMDLSLIDHVGPLLVVMCFWEHDDLLVGLADNCDQKIHEYHKYEENHDDIYEVCKQHHPLIESELVIMFTFFGLSVD